MNYHILYAETCLEDFARPGNELDALLRGCRKSEFQFLDRNTLTASLADEGGIVFPDFMIYENCVPLISELFRQALDQQKIDNLFYKRIILADEALGIREHYWLALPPRINCLDMDKCEIEIEENPYEEEEERLAEVVRIAVNPRATGNYKIFKLPERFENQEIIVSDDLRAAIEPMQFANVYFTKL